MTPGEIIEGATEALSMLVYTATEYEGLIPSIIDRETGTMLTELPPDVLALRSTPTSVALIYPPEVSCCASEQHRSCGDRTSRAC